MFAKTVETAQKRVEGNNFDVRKHLLNYDDVMNNQRTIMYEKRNEILDNESIRENVLNGFKEYITNMVMGHLIENKKLEDKDYEEIIEAANENLLKRHRLNLSEINSKKEDEVIDIIYENVLNDYEEKLSDIPEEVANEFEKAISLRVIDSHWMNHISTMSHLREGVGLRGYANENPLQAYTMEGYQLFDDMLNKINSEISIYLLKSEIRKNTERKEVVKKVIANDELLNGASFDINDYLSSSNKTNNDCHYIRLTIIDEKGNHAYTRAYYVKELID
jgi:preprotein translocase subunit SecA